MEHFVFKIKHLQIILDLCALFYVYECFLCIYACDPCVRLVPLEGAANALELDSQMVANHVGAER